MDYDQFLGRVGERASVGAQEASKVAHATLVTLAERVDHGEAMDLASQLPSQLKDSLEGPSNEAKPFDSEEFVRRVAERAGLGTPSEARPHVAAVLTTLQEAVSAGELDDLLSQLPDEYRELFAQEPRR